jgi:hypothetical protein
MASNTLTSNSISSTYSQILHIGTGTAGAATVRTGDGSTTVLSFVSGGAKVTGTFEGTGDATFAGAVAAAGRVSGIGISEYRRITSDVTAATTTQVDIPAFDFVPVSGAVYHIEMDLIATSAATTTGVRLVNTSGAGTLILADPANVTMLSAIGGTYAATAAPVATSSFGLRLAGVFTASSTAALSFAVVSEIAASSVSLKAGSILKITRIS